MSKKANFNKLKVFETFAGIGAQHKALEILRKKFNYDYEIVATSEWDVYANIAYDAIHNKSKKVPKLSEKEIDEYLSNYDHSLNGKDIVDIKKILSLDKNIKKRLYKSFFNSNNLGSILKITGKSLIEKTKGEGVDLITYSFPCQDLSVSGSFHGFNKGMQKGSGTRSSLLWEIERILFELKELDKLPKFLLLENVKNMLSKKHEKHYFEFLKSLLLLGYSTKTYVLNAKDYGIPQNRERVYALSILNYEGKIDKYGEILDPELKKDNLKKITKNKTLKDILKTNYSISKYKEEAIESQPNKTPSRKIMFLQNKHLNDFKNVKYSRTLTTKQDRHPNAGIINLKGTIIGDNNRNSNLANYRFITPREAYLLMGFSDKDFEKVKKENIKKEIMLHQAGNSIVVDVIAMIMLLIQEINNK